MSQNKRQEFVKEQIAKLYSLLQDWEKYQLSARDPGEKERSKNEIERIKQFLTDYESEQQGGAKVNEDLRGPLVGPAIRKNNKRWVIGILIALVLIVGAYFLLTTLNKTHPNYDKYLSYLQQGDSLVTANKYPEAKVAYKKSLAYNPGDSAVIRKIDYLKKADELIAQNKFDEAKQLFKVIVEIKASPTLASVEDKEDVPAENKVTIGQLSLSFEWKDGVLLIKVSGGNPFTEGGKPPYIVEGLECTDCIKWTSDKQNYTGRVEHANVKTSSLKVKDSKGLSTQADVPKYSDSPRDIANDKPAEEGKSVPLAENKIDNDFNTLVESGDKNFAANKFLQAQQDYENALSIKPAAKELVQKIENCKKKLEDEKINSAKNIPRQNISANSFTMGTENGNPEDRPEHTVKISSFAMGKTEVTVAQYKAYCNFTGKTMPPAPSFGWIDDYPITNVTWDEAKAYCNWVGGRLPTEAEWEFAAKGAATTDNIYSGSNQPGSIAVYKDNSGNKPSAVGKKSPNKLGLYDMTGNVFEWCSDWFNKKYYSNTEESDPQGPSSGKEKVIRGGAFNSSVASSQDGNQLKVTYRNSEAASSRQNYIGFRVVWDR